MVINVFFVLIRVELVIVVLMRGAVLQLGLRLVESFLVQGRVFLEHHLATNWPLVLVVFIVYINIVSGCERVGIVARLEYPCGLAQLPLIVGLG